MNVLDIIEDINFIRSQAIKFAQGEISQDDLRSSIEVLVNNVSRPTNQKVHAVAIPRSAETVKEQVLHEGVKYQLDTTKPFFMNEGKRLVYKLESDDKGMAVQESHGYVIFVPLKDLDMLKPVDKITDINGLDWNIFETFDENTIRAENEIGDVVFGLKEVQELIDGESPMEVK